MTKVPHIQSLLYALAVVLIIAQLDRLKCEAVLVVSSSSSLYGSSCNGLQCPPHTNCAAFTNSINGNSTEDKRCTTDDGKIVRQETIIKANGQICIKNVTTVHNQLIVDQHCRKMNRQEQGIFYNRESNIRLTDDLDDALEDAKDSLEDAIGREEGSVEDMRDKIYEEKERKRDYLQKVQDYRERLFQYRKDQLQKEYEERHEAWEKYMEKMEERLDYEAQQREREMELRQASKLLQMERRRDQMERKAEMLEEQRDENEELQKDRIERALKALNLMANSRNFRRMRG